MGCRHAVDGIIIYSTAPVSMIVGEAEVTDTVGGSPDEVWEQTADFSGISREFFDSYYDGKARAFAYRLGEVKEYESPKQLADVGIAKAPQSFVYLPSSAEASLA